MTTAEIIVAELRLRRIELEFEELKRDLEHGMPILATHRRPPAKGRKDGLANEPRFLGFGACAPLSYFRRP